METWLGLRGTVVHQQKTGFC